MCCEASEIHSVGVSLLMFLGSVSLASRCVGNLMSVP